jgi:hypothetical protein
MLTLLERASAVPQALELYVFSLVPLPKRVGSTLQVNPATICLGVISGSLLPDRIARPVEGNGVDHALTGFVGKVADASFEAPAIVALEDDRPSFDPVNGDSQRPGRHDWSNFEVRVEVAVETVNEPVESAVTVICPARSVR